MTITLQAATEERDRRDALRLRLAGDPLRLDGATLARRCYGATLAAARDARVTLSDHERDALAAEVAVAVVTRYGPSPLRTEVGGDYLRTIALNLLRTEGAAGRAWRDVAGDYRTRVQRDRDTGPMIVALDAERSADDPLAAAILAALARDGSPVPVMALDALDLAADLSGRVAAALNLRGERERRPVEVAILAAALRADDREAAPLASIARDTGMSLVTVKRASAAGNAVLASLGATRLAALARESSDALSLARRIGSDRPTLDGSALDALATVDRAQRDYRRPGRAVTAPGSRATASAAPLSRFTRTATLPVRREPSAADRLRATAAKYRANADRLDADGFPVPAAEDRATAAMLSRIAGD